MSRIGTVPMTHLERNSFDQRAAETCGEPLGARVIETIQANIGLTCDLACRHCHVESSPKRTEQMDWQTMQLVLDAVKRANVKTLDITGGAPEMNPNFQRFVTVARSRGINVLVRTNLTIMNHDGYTELPSFYCDHGVRLVASLPCYMSENVDRQRGLRVYEKSIDVIRRLNSVGYGIEPDLTLTLVYNPVGPSLPPEQASLERDYRRELQTRFGIRFTQLHTITNMPIGRFAHDLRRDGLEDQYQQLLREAFNPGTLDGLMCRGQIHVSWDGVMHDCDFNYALGLPTDEKGAQHIRDFDPESLARRRIVTGEHCYGCTAGLGSSCGGTLT